MNQVLIDTCMWSLAFRRKGNTGNKVSEEISNLINENRAKIIGLIRLEVLSGYSDIKSYTTLRDKLRYFPNEAILDSDYEVAAEYSNLCRKNGIQGSHTDFFICAVSVRLNMQIFTEDKDFNHYSRCLPINLYEMN